MHRYVYALTYAPFPRINGYLRKEINKVSTTLVSLTSTVDGLKSITRRHPHHTLRKAFVSDA